MEEEKDTLADKRKSVLDDEGSQNSGGDDLSPKRRRKGKKKKKKKNKKKDDSDSGDNSGPETVQDQKKKTAINNDQFIINARYNLIKMLGFGTFGEIHLAYDTQTRQLNAIKFEVASQKNPQLKHEFNILEQLNKVENSIVPEGIPKVYIFDRIENKCNFMIMEFLGPSLSDLFQFKSKQFSLTTVLLIGIQMLQRIEYIHEKGFIHRDIKPENFVIGLNEKSNIVHIIDFGLSKRYKDKNTGQHIPYRENRHLVGTARYASINAHLGIEQSRRDDIESIGYVLVYFLLGRLPWQSKQEKGKQPVKIMEKKLITPPEILCKKLPMEFAYYFHYCKNLKYEDRPDYATLKSLFYDLLLQQINLNHYTNEFVFDWYDDAKEEIKETENIPLGPGSNKKAAKTNFNVITNMIIEEVQSTYNNTRKENSGINFNTPDDLELDSGNKKDTKISVKQQGHGDLIDFKDINNNFNTSDRGNLIRDKLIGHTKEPSFSFNKNDFMHSKEGKDEDLIKLKTNNGSSSRKQEKSDSNKSFSESGSSDDDTERMDAKGNNDADIKKIVKSMINFVIISEFGISEK
jgi:serine/threonine protein kinase